MEAELRPEDKPEPSLAAAKRRNQRTSTSRSNLSAGVRFRDGALASYAVGSDDALSDSLPSCSAPSRSTAGVGVHVGIRPSLRTAGSNLTAPSNYSTPIYRQPRGVASRRFHASMSSVRADEGFTEKLFRGMSQLSLFAPAVELGKKIEKHCAMLGVARSQSELEHGSQSDRKLGTMQRVFSEISPVEARHHALRGEELHRHPDEMRKGRCKAIARRFTNHMRSWQSAFFVVCCDRGPMSAELRFDWDPEKAVSEHAFKRVHLSSVRAVTASMLLEPGGEPARSREFRVVCSNFTLKLRAPTRKSMKLWVTALPQFARQARGNGCMRNMLNTDKTLEKYVYRHFQRLESDGTGTDVTSWANKIEMQEIRELLAVYASREYIAEICAEFDADCTGLVVEDLPELFQLFAVKDALLPTFERYSVLLPAEPDWRRTLGRPRALTNQSRKSSKYRRGDTDKTDSLRTLSGIQKLKSNRSVGTVDEQERQRALEGIDISPREGSREDSVDVEKAESTRSVAFADEHEEWLDADADLPDTRESVESTRDDMMRRSKGINAEGLRSFLQKEQGEVISAEAAEGMLETRREPHIVEVADERFLTEAGFSQLLASTANAIFDLEMRGNVHEDMTQPLSHYWISCSHNTYLEADQLLGQSSLEQYMDVIFQRGCRCVEIDIHDGRDGEPIVKHGWTPTSSILFSEVVTVCKEYAFKASPYPLILSLEMHCGARQKRRVGEVLSTILGDHLLRLPDDGGLEVEQLTSPQAAMHKVIVKGKVPHQVHAIWKESFSSTFSIINDDEDSSDGRDSGPGGHVEVPRRRCSFCSFLSRPWKSTKLSTTSAGSSRDTSAQRAASFATQRRGIRSGHTASIGGGEGLDQKRQGVLEYARTLYLIAKKLSPGHSLVARASGFKPCNITSFSEKAAVKLVEKHSVEAVRDHNRLYLGRVYPTGTRFGSTNFDPMPMWLAGYQLVALNYQSHDMSTLLNAGLFRHINGGSGYVLKPQYVAGKDPPPDDRPPDSPPGEPGGGDAAAACGDDCGCTLEITVLSGHCLPKGPPASGIEVFHPIVRVSIFGEDDDMWVGCTSRVEANGFNPSWSNQFEFPICHPCVAMLCLEVCHSASDPAATSWCFAPSSADLQQLPVVASTAYPLRSLRDGIRWVPLRDEQHHTLPQSGLLVEVRFVGPWAEWRRRQRTITELASQASQPPSVSLSMPSSHSASDASLSVAAGLADLDGVVLECGQDEPPQETCLTAVPTSCAPHLLNVYQATDEPPQETCLTAVPTSCAPHPLNVYQATGAPAAPTSERVFGRGRFDEIEI